MRYLVASIAVCLYTGAQAQPAAPATLGPQAPFSAGEPATAGGVNQRFEALLDAINEDRAVIGQLIDLVLTQQAELEVLRTATPGVQGVTCGLIRDGFELGCRGEPCSPDNPGWVVLPTDEPGHHVRVRLERRISFTAMPALPLATTPGIGWDPPRPFFLYAVLSSEGEVGFALSPNPARTRSPAAANITWRGHVTRPADDDTFFMLEPNQPWGDRPALLLGRVPLRKDADDNWELPASAEGVARQGLGPNDCLGRIDDGTWFGFPVNQMGARGDYYLSSFEPNDSPPRWSNSGEYGYQIGRDGQVRVSFSTEGVGAEGNRVAASAGIGRLSLHIPYRMRHSIVPSEGKGEWFPIGATRLSGAGHHPLIGHQQGLGNFGRPAIELFADDADVLSALTPARLPAGCAQNCKISVNFAYRAF